MDSEFEFLRRFDRELSARAKADARREASPAPKYPRRWKPWVAAAAALLVLAAGIGFLANSNFTGSQASMAAEGSAPRPQAPDLQAVPDLPGGSTVKRGVTTHYAAGTTSNQNASASQAPGLEQTVGGSPSHGAPADLFLSELVPGSPTCPSWSKTDSRTCAVVRTTVPARPTAVPARPKAPLVTLMGFAILIRFMRGLQIDGSHGVPVSITRKRSPAQNVARSRGRVRYAWGSLRAS